MFNTNVFNVNYCMIISIYNNYLTTIYKYY